MRIAFSTLLVLAALAVVAQGYTTGGNRIYDVYGNPVLLRGIDRPSLEWSQTGDNINWNDWNNMKSWGANVIRIPLNQCFWNGNQAYQDFVDQQVQTILSLGMGVILDLHWSDKGGIDTCTQQTMADNNSVDFWSSVAAKYRNHPWIIFELYNEPHDVSWWVWKNGGDAGGYYTPGFQKLIDTVRAAGANNAVIINGLNWAYDLSGVPDNLIQGSNIIYGTHPYSNWGKMPSDWDAGFGNLAWSYPVIATEFGTTDCSTDYYQQFMNYANSHAISWTAWAWYPGGCQFPTIINDWSGSPNGPGQIVQNSLRYDPKTPQNYADTVLTKTVCEK